MSQTELPSDAALPIDPTAPHPAPVDALPGQDDADEDGAVEAADATAEPVTEATASAPAAPRVDPGPALKSLFPALFAGAAKPIKLRIQVDIQARAPGQFTKPALSAFLRRHTGSTGYLIALSKAQTRFDLDGQPAGDITDEHRQAAIDELKRRRAVSDERRALEEQQRRNRAQLLADFETTTLTRPNFCALKGVVEDQLDGLLDTARREAAEWASLRPPQRDARDARDPRGPRRDAAPRGRGPGAEGGFEARGPRRDGGRPGPRR